ncbi:efflux RND transporter periplasmic adaptor subunit [methanotrophic endosymbiont of Bathymodiolus puteoserpentis (Logatchev)]|jgi:Cu(I)/Ag(I) efflux system membrane fusion protein|uniref:efflux RND transporter periplasmic adaptor subunit n=1 Tax=methanotrophic endosymbiont of Bathymodiolus puteoserpentis (Logatchev) TaxID=343235 RepID=UPI0013CDA217|nr:efflux RND transporter periplasmic adaptor subunit [methanotrophic endosymbiont of Bathymodiolus puteoserpentis (Logatchev)]SHE23606.1 Probable Co/Zn/Cd efflux system membrane fusion protein [methanotrophic endosymbiont of Bathymodiolus puteoserpentis (Logatchev)]
MNKTALMIAPIMLTVGLAGGYWYADSKQAATQAKTEGSTARKILFYRNPMNPSVTSPTPAKDSMGMDYVPVYAEPEKPAERKILFYRSPMNPSVTSPTPAKDSMGMDYVPVYAESDTDAKAPAGTVKIDGTTIQNIGVRTIKAVKASLSHTVRAVGRVDYDEERMVHLHPKTEGWIEKLHVDKTGQWVKKNTDLLSIYSPQLVASQQEYILALNNLKALEASPIADIRQGAEELVISSRERLKLLDVPEHQLRELQRTHKVKKSLHIHAPEAGIIMKIGAREGQFVTPATEIYMIADLRKIWVYADIYEYELPWVKEGDSVEMQLAGIPGKTFKGHLTYIYPYAEAKTRTIKVRLVFDNPDLLLKPEMFAEITIFADKQKDAIIIPSEAVIRSGPRNQVFVVREPGKFEPRLVTLGLSSSGKVIVLKGVKEGEEVVTSAQFLIDSESKLREATAKMLNDVVGESSTSTEESVIKGQDTNHENMNHKGMNHENINHEGMNHENMSHENMNHEGMNHENMSDVVQGDNK